jgi:hypothetical protein
MAALLNGKAEITPMWKNPINGRVWPVPRHREVKQGTVRAICKQLNIPKP